MKALISGNLFSLSSLVLFFFLAGCGDEVREYRQTTGGFETLCHHKYAKKAYNRPYEIKGIKYVPQPHYELNEVGIASYYGGTDVFHGRKTSNGEIFDMNTISAAHKHLPLPCIVRVTNLENGRSIKVKINDRGPFIDGRVIDVSRKTAQMLGFYRKGTARVHLETVVPDTLQLTRGEIDDETLQMAEVNHHPNPQELLDSLERSNGEPQIIPTKAPVFQAALPKRMVSSPGGEIVDITAMKPIPFEDFQQNGDGQIMMEAAGRDPIFEARSPISRVDPHLQQATAQVKPSFKKSSKSTPTFPKVLIGTHGYFVQVITERNQQDAQKILNRLRQRFPPRLVRLETMQFGPTAHYRVLMGPFKQQSEAGLLLKQVTIQGYSQAMIVHHK